MKNKYNVDETKTIKEVGEIIANNRRKSPFESYNFQIIHNTKQGDLIGITDETMEGALEKFNLTSKEVVNRDTFKLSDVVFRAIYFWTGTEAVCIKSEFLYENF